MDVITVLLLLIVGKGVLSLTLQSYYACYGTTGLDNFLQIQCGTDKIATMALYANAKISASGCPDTVSITNKASVPLSCCEYNVTDCVVRYEGNVYKAYYQQCNAKSSCTLQVSWINTPCVSNTTTYISRTNYMKMDYYCISDQALDTCTNLETTDSPTFLWNAGYPATPMAGSGSCTCSVEVDCDSTIQVTALDLRLNEESGVCMQTIVIRDGTTSRTFDCSSNNEYLPTVLYTSQSHFIKVSINDNTVTSGGFYFISIQGTSATGKIRLGCGSSFHSSPSTDAALLSPCPVSTTTATTSLTPALSTVTVPSSSDEISEVMDTTLQVMDTTLPESLSATTIISSTQTLSTDISDSIMLPYINSTILEPLSSLIITMDSMSFSDNVSLTDTSYLDPSMSDHSTHSIGSTFLPSFSTLSWTSTEDDVNTNRTQACCDDETLPKGSTWIAAVVVIVVILGVILLLVFYREKLKNSCCKKKETDDPEENPTNIDPIANFNPVGRGGQLPPLQTRMDHPMKREITFSKTPLDPIPFSSSNILANTVPPKDHTNLEMSRHKPQKHKKDETLSKKKKKKKKKQTNNDLFTDQLMAPRYHTVLNTTAQGRTMLDSLRTSEAIQEDETVTKKKKKAKRKKSTRKVSSSEDTYGP